MRDPCGEREGRDREGRHGAALRADRLRLQRDEQRSAGRREPDRDRQQRLAAGAGRAQAVALQPARDQRVQREADRARRRARRPRRRGPR
jgi:hypothetical protein